jgi:hypothetical protein
MRRAKIRKENIHTGDGHSLQLKKTIFSLPFFPILPFLYGMFISGGNVYANMHFITINMLFGCYVHTIIAMADFVFACHCFRVPICWRLFCTFPDRWDGWSVFFFSSSACGDGGWWSLFPSQKRGNWVAPIPRPRSYSSPNSTAFFALFCCQSTSSPSLPSSVPFARLFMLCPFSVPPRGGVTASAAAAVHPLPFPTDQYSS